MSDNRRPISNKKLYGCWHTQTQVDLHHYWTIQLEANARLIPSITTLPDPQLISSIHSANKMAESAADENAAERRFGPQFDDIHILSNAQVAVSLQVSAGQAVTRDEEFNEGYRTTQKYAETFGKQQ